MTAALRMQLLMQQDEPCGCGDFVTCDAHRIWPQSPWNPPIRCERCRELTPARMMTPDGVCWDCDEELGR